MLSPPCLCRLERKFSTKFQQSTRGRERFCTVQYCAVISIVLSSIDLNRRSRRKVLYSSEGVRWYGDTPGTAQHNRAQDWVDELEGRRSLDSIVSSRFGQHQKRDPATVDPLRKPLWVLTPRCIFTSNDDPQMFHL